MRHININGHIHKETNASVTYDNRAFRFGFGLFETMLMQDGKIMLKEYHFERLYASIEQLNFVMPELMTREWIENEIKRTVKKNKMEKLCRIRFQIYAGRGGLFDGQHPWTEFLIECQYVDPIVLQLNQKGLITKYAEGLAKSNDSIANLKSCNAMVYALAARQALKNNVDDTIILNTKGNGIETTIANIFCIKKDVIYTPPLSEGCIAGVMRRHVLDQLEKSGFDVQEEPFTKKFLKEADSIFATNAIRRIKWVQSIDSQEYKIGKVLDVYENISY